jgi:energy-coupling factor transporter ATP-binding protein EcfA2
MTHTNRFISSDLPNDDPAFGYQQFAKHICDGLLAVSKPEGLVVAIYGPWGSGKTTLLNLVARNLDQIPSELKPLIIRFDPWMFSGTNDLLLHFFDQLVASLNKWSLVGKKITKPLADLCELIAVSPDPVVGFSAKVIKGARELGKKNLTEVRAKLIDELRNQTNRIIIIIDDLDRLSPKEIEQLFGLVKSVANFPNVIYLLAFDRKLVEESLPKVAADSPSYLEKIVQAAYDLPVPDPAMLVRHLLLNIRESWNFKNLQLFDDDYFWSVVKCIEKFLRTPRDVVRLMTSMELNFPSVKGEVNFADFMALEVLRLFSYDLYIRIRSHPAMFSGRAILISLENLRQFHTSWSESVKKQKDGDCQIELVKMIFPKVAFALSNATKMPDSSQEWHDEKRAASLEKFHSYFRYLYFDISIAESEYAEIKEVALDENALQERLELLCNQKRADGRTRFLSFCEKLCLDSEIPKIIFPSLIICLFRLGCRLYERLEEPLTTKISVAQEEALVLRNIEYLGLERIGIVFPLIKLLRLIDKPEREQLTNRALIDSTEPYIFVDLIYQAIQPVKDTAIEPLFDQEFIIKLQKAMTDMFERLSTEGTLLSKSHVARLLRAWQDWDTIETVRNWIDTLPNESLADLIESYVTISVSHNSNHVVGKYNFSFSANNIEPLLNEATKVKINNLETLNQWAETKQYAVDNLKHYLKKDAVSPDPTGM